MNNNCGQIKDWIADLVTGVLGDLETEAVEEHIKECSGCRDYLQVLWKEDELLTQLFCEFDAKAASRQERVINALNSCNVVSSNSMLSVLRAIWQSSLTKFVATAAVFAFTALCFIITLVWISQIREYIQYCTTVTLS